MDEGFDKRKAQEVFDQVDALAMRLGLVCRNCMYFDGERCNEYHHQNMDEGMYVSDEDWCSSWWGSDDD